MGLDDLKQIITKVRHFSSNAIIGGGAIRDTLLNRPVKDIDIFLNEDPDYCLTAIVRSLNGTGQYTDRTPVNGEYTNLALADVPMKDLPPVQLIFIERDPVDDVHDYDFGLSQCFMTPKGICSTAYFASDFRMQRFTYMGSDKTDIKARKRSADRLQRMKLKYPTFTFINTEPLINIPEEAFDLELELAKL